MIRIALCDDNTLHLAAAERLLREGAVERNCEVCIDAYSDANALLLAFENREAQAAIAVLDISMNDMDGITLAKRINAVAPHCQIIFLTSYIAYVMDVYEAEHVYLVLKEKQSERLWPAVEKAWERYHGFCKDTFAVRSGKGVRILHYGEVVSLERQGRKTCLQLTEDVVLTSDTLDTLEKRLPERFVRCHQSIIVNLDFVLEFDKDIFRLRDGRVLPISRAHRKDAAERFWRYMRIPAMEK